MMTHWKKLHNPDYLGAYALLPGQDMILTIKFVQNETVIGPDGKKEECTVAHFEENAKPMILNSTNCKTIQKIYKTPYVEEWSGKKIQIYTEKVKAFGEIVEALRIRPFLPKVERKTTDLACSDCGKQIEAFQGKTPEYLAQYTYDKYGKSLCWRCAKDQKANVPEDALNEADET